MIIDIRYHIASLVAIFLALGIGMLIGNALLGNDALVVEQEKMISRLEKEFDRLKVELKEEQEAVQKQTVELEVDRQFHRSILPSLIRDRLLDRRILIVRTNDSSDIRIAKELAQVLRAAGAEVPSITTFHRWPNLNDPTERQAVAVTLGKDPNNSRWVPQMFSDIMEELGSGRESAFLIHLQSQDFIQLSGDYAKGPADTLVLIGGEQSAEENRTRDIDIPILDASKKLGLTVVGVEPLSSPGSYIKDYRKKGITTVDNIETVPGQVALILALSEGKRGNYGVKDTARALLPDIAGKGRP